MRVQYDHMVGSQFQPSLSYFKPQPISPLATWRAALCPLFCSLEFDKKNCFYFPTTINPDGTHKWEFHYHKVSKYRVEKNNNNNITNYTVCKNTIQCTSSISTSICYRSYWKYLVRCSEMWSVRACVFFFFLRVTQGSCVRFYGYKLLWQVSVCDALKKSCKHVLFYMCNNHIPSTVILYSIPFMRNVMPT